MVIAFNFIYRPSTVIFVATIREFQVKKTKKTTRACQAGTTGRALPVKIGDGAELDATGAVAAACIAGALAVIGATPPPGAAGAGVEDPPGSWVAW